MSFDMISLVKTARIFTDKHAPEILTGAGIAGIITTTILTVKATTKANMVLEEKKLDLDKENLSGFETVKAVWPYYLPVVISGATSILCIIGANSVHVRRNAALATAYSLSETALKEYKDKVAEKIGIKKEHEIRDSIAKDKIDKNPVSDNTIIMTNNGETLCYEPLSGRYFKSDINKIKTAINELNRRVIFDTYVSLNDFYDLLGLESNDLGDKLGWRMEQNGIEIDFSSQLSSNEVPCLVIDFLTLPTYDYSQLL